MLHRRSLNDSANGAWRWYLVVLAATVLTFDDLLTGDRIPAFRDLLGFILPMQAFLGDHLRRGELPLWNPLILIGTPFLANFHRTNMFLRGVVVPKGPIPWSSATGRHRSVKEA